MPWLQWQTPEGVSMKLWHHLWPFNGLKLTLNWKRYRSPTGSWILKKVLDSGRIRAIISFLSTPIDGTSLYLNISIKRFQEAMASGKKLFKYLFDLHFITWKVVRIFPLNNSLQLRGNLYFKYEGVLWPIILWICKTRLHLRRSDKFSQPNSS